MKFFFLTLLPCAIFTLSFTPFPSRFPAIDNLTTEGKVITDEYFKKGNTLVIHMHLGCPPAMVLLQDIQEAKRSVIEEFQILIITENTPEQVALFNSTEKNLWSNIRNSFGLIPLKFDIIAECEKSKIIQKEGNIIIQPQCRKIARKLLTRSSPSIYFVDSHQRITQSVKGYSAKSNQALLEAMLKEAP